MITVDFAFRLAESINTILTLERGASYSETWSAAKYEKLDPKIDHKKFNTLFLIANLASNYC
jgi:hypothetical protein